MPEGSWIPSANVPGTDFPLQNLPYGVFAASDGDRIGVAIGEGILDLKECARTGVLADLASEINAALREPTLNALMSLGTGAWSALRGHITSLLHADASQSTRRQIEHILVPRQEALMKLPCAIGDYTDFFASLYHATNTGRLSRSDDPLPASYKHLPIAYHGRASTVVISGTPVRRPSGQLKSKAAEMPVFGPTKSLDFEVEFGMFIGPGNSLGSPIGIEQAGSHIFGYCLLNDWSARDMQAWESRPLGPFLGKSFATTISPWIVTAEALEPFRIQAFGRPEVDPPVLSYLTSAADREHGALDITLTAYLRTAQMASAGMPAVRLSRTSSKYLYWTPAQFVAHHSSNGCSLRPGDLFGSGTASGPANDSLGCLLEHIALGLGPIELPTGERRAFLQDGDEIILSGCCERDGFHRIGFGNCCGMIVS